MSPVDAAERERWSLERLLDTIRRFKRARHDTALAAAVVSRFDELERAREATAIARRKASAQLAASRRRTIHPERSSGGLEHSPTNHLD
jgi:hypothetical protein